MIRPAGRMLLARRLKATVAMIAVLSALGLGRAEAVTPIAVQTDGLGFPVYPRSTSYMVFGTGLMYVASGDIVGIVEWYRERSGRQWTGGSIQRNGAERTAELSFDDEMGTRRVRILQRGGAGGMIQEQLELTPAAEALAFAGGRALRGATDRLGVPLYPHRINGRSGVLVQSGRGFVAYETADDFKKVRAWFNARLSNRFVLSYHANTANGVMQTFNSDGTTVTITRRVSDGVTTVGVATLR